MPLPHAGHEFHRGIPYTWESAVLMVYALGVPMDDSGANPLVVALLFLVRCLVPLALMLGISYLLRRLGLITEPPPEENGTQERQDTRKGGRGHGRA
jgi:hypothetical protein